MRRDEFLRLLERKPFIRMRVCLSDDTAYDIESPEDATAARSHVIGEDKIYVYSAREHQWFRITHVEDLGPAETASSR